MDISEIAGKLLDLALLKNLSKQKSWIRIEKRVASKI